MRHTLHIILALTLLLVGCYSDPRQVELVDRAEAVMDSLPETALALLDSVDSHRLVRADNARYRLHHTRSLTYKKTFKPAAALCSQRHGNTATLGKVLQRYAQRQQHRR